MRDKPNASFRSGKDVYYDRIRMPGFKDNISREDPNSKYARAARLGLCFKCFTEDENPQHRPKHRVFAFCPDCMEDMAKGMERLELRTKNEVNRWFKD